MTRRQWTVLIAVALVTAAALAGVVAVGSKGGSTTSRLARHSATTTTTTTATTLPPVTGTTIGLAPVARSATTAPPPPHSTVPTTAAPPTSPTTARPPVLTGAGNFLTVPQLLTTRTGDPQNCVSFADPGWTASCGPMAQGGVQMLWLIESRPAGTVSGWRVYVLRQVTSGQWDVVLTTTDDTGKYLSGIKAVTADVIGDGGQEAVLGFHDYGVGFYVEVVSSPGRVTLHHLYVQGSATVSTGQLDAWGLSGAGPNFEHDAIRFLSGAWRQVSSAVVPPPPPPSQI